MSNHRIAITGLGNICAAGIGLEEVAAALSEPGTIEPGVFAEVHDFDIADFVSTKQSYLDRHTALGMAAVSLTMENAGVEIAGSTADCGIAVGTALGNAQTTEAFMKTLFAKGGKYVSPFLFTHAYPNTTASMAAIAFSLKGPMINLFGDATAGLNAVIAAADTLRQGAGKAIVTLGAEAPGALDRQALEQAPEGAPPPAEGAAALVLERLDSVVNRGGSSHAELKAEATRSFDWDDADGVVNAIRLLADDTIDASDVDKADILLVDGAPLWTHDVAPPFSVDGLKGPVIAIEKSIGRALAACGPLGLVLGAALVSPRAGDVRGELAKHLADGAEVNTAMIVSLDEAGSAAGVLIQGARRKP